jgi:hypothetical protein
MPQNRMHESRPPDIGRGIFSRFSEEESWFCHGTGVRTKTVRFFGREVEWHLVSKDNPSGLLENEVIGKIIKLDLNWLFAETLNRIDALKGQTKPAQCNALGKE